jgi:RNA polymerase sigma-70 factor (ECF subfamily)
MRRSVACFARLMRLCRRQGRSPEDSEDLIQEALLRLEEYCRTAKTEIRNRDEFLARTVRNLSIDQIRHERVVCYAPEPVEKIASYAPFVDSAPTPDRILDAEQRLSEIGSALARVSVRMQEIYFLHLAGYQYKEIAARFGLSAKTVEKHMTRALLTLMKLKKGAQE